MTDPDDDDRADPGAEQPSAPNSKVQRGIEEYELRGLGAELEASWTGEDGARTSLRELADRFNRRVLQVAMEGAGLSPLEGEVRSKYEALTGDDVSSGVQIQARRDLERQGVDIDAVESDFVTHQAMHTYLTQYRGAELPSESETDQFSKAEDTIQRLKSRTVAVIENTLERLRSNGRLATGDLSVFVDVRVTCTDCGSQYDVGSLLEARQCDCEVAPDGEV